MVGALYFLFLPIFRHLSAIHLMHLMCTLAKRNVSSEVQAPNLDSTIINIVFSILCIWGVQTPFLTLIVSSCHPI